MYLNCTIYATNTLDITIYSFRMVAKIPVWSDPKRRTADLGGARRSPPTWSCAEAEPCERPAQSPKLSRLRGLVWVHSHAPHSGQLGQAARPGSPPPPKESTSIFPMEPIRNVPKAEIGHAALRCCIETWQGLREGISAAPDRQ